MKDTDYLLALLKNAINQTEMEAVEEQRDWTVIYEIADKSTVASIVYTTVLKLPLSLQPDMKLMTLWKNQTFAVGFSQLVQRTDLKRLLTGLAELDIHPVIFKGPALAVLYPEPLMRGCGDVDMLVKEKDRDRVTNYLQTHNFKLIEEQWGGEVLSYSLENKMDIEIHFRLWEGYHGKRISILENMEMNMHTIRIKTEEYDFDTLDYEEHLIYQIYHLVKHFSLEGISLRFLTDLTIFVNTYKKNIDFTSFWKKLNKLRYDDFCQLIFAICVEKLGMDKHALNQNLKVDQGIVQSLLEDILTVGLFFEKDNISWSTLHIIKPYLTGENDSSGSRIGIYRAALFPKKVQLIEHYPYLDKLPILLPLAWIQRSYHILFVRKKANMVPKIKKAQNRLDLMRKVKLIKNYK